jgi:hypothetical protein
MPKDIEVYYRDQVYLIRRTRDGRLLLRDREHGTLAELIETEDEMAARAQGLVPAPFAGGSWWMRAEDRVRLERYSESGVLPELAYVLSLWGIEIERVLGFLREYAALLDEHPQEEMRARAWRVRAAIRRLKEARGFDSPAVLPEEEFPEWARE